MHLSVEERKQRCQQILSKIEKSQICELKAIHKPPQLMNKFGQLMIMIINPNSASKPYQWRNFLIISSGQPHKFLETLWQFDDKNISEVQKKNINAFINKNQLNNEQTKQKIKKMSGLFTHLLEWIFTTFPDTQKQ